MRERTPSADDTPKRAPPAPPREAASADAAGSNTSNGSLEVLRIAKLPSATTASIPTTPSTTTTSSTPSTDNRMVASAHNLDDLGVSHPASASNDRQQQLQEKHGHAYRSAQTAQDKRSRLSNVINNLRKKVPDSRSADSPRKEEDDRNSVERNLETLEKYVMTVLNGVIKDEEEDDREIGRKRDNDRAEKSKESEKMSEEQEDEDSKGPAAKFEPSKPNESRTEVAVLLEQPEKADNAPPVPESSDERPFVREKRDCGNEERSKKDVVSNCSGTSRIPEATETARTMTDLGSSTQEQKREQKVEAAGYSELCPNISPKEITKSEHSAQEETRGDSQEIAEEKKESRSLGAIIMDRLSDHQTEDKVAGEVGKEDHRKFAENLELRNICRELLNDLLNGIKLIDENGQDEESRTSEGSCEESRDSRTSQEFSMTSLHCSLPLDKVASVLQNCQTNELVGPQSPSSSTTSSSSSSSSSMGSMKSPSKPPSPTVRHLCLYCDRKFLSISLRQRHTERVHQLGGGRRSERNSRKPSQNCQYCSDKCAESLEGLFQHMVGSHGDKYHACVQCSTRYLTREALVGHMNENHGGGVERTPQIQEKMKESSAPGKEIGSQSPREKSEQQSPKERRTEEADTEHRTESILLKPIVSTTKESFGNPGSPEFDSSFYSSVSCNIRENLLHHLDGKLQTASSPATLATSPAAESKQQQQPQQQQQQQSFYDNHSVNQIQFPIDISLTAATPVYTKDYTAEEYENSSEYAQKPGKSNRSHPRRVSFEKYNFPRKYDGKEQWTCSIKDLSKFDIYTQLTLRKKQQVLKERVTLNRHQASISETTDIVRNDQDPDSSNLDGIAEGSAVSENSVTVPEQSSRWDLQKSSSAESKRETSEVSLTHHVTGTKFTKFSAEFGSFLRLRKWEENSGNEPGKVQEAVYAELTGEWSRPRIYICGACASRHVTLREMEDHKASTHPNVWCSHLEFSGDQRELYKHLFLPGRSVATAKARNAILSEKVCTKCSKNCNTLPELHRHMLECGGDQAWLLGLFGNGKKKCKWRPFGSRSRRRRQRGMKRNIQNSQTPRVNAPKEKQPTGPRVRPSDRESIQKMLANLPPKRATRKVLQESTLRNQGRLRNVQTRSRQRMVGDNSSASRMSRNKAVLRNKLLKNAKSIQRNRCRSDNISAIIESVVKSYYNGNEKKPEDEEGEAESHETYKDAKEKSESRDKSELDDGDGRGKIARGPRVLGKKRNVRAKSMEQGKAREKIGNFKTKTKVAAKAAAEVKVDGTNETTKTSKHIKNSKAADKETDANRSASSPVESKSPSLSTKNKSPTQITPKKRRPVDPVASLNASIKAKSQLRTHDGKFARNPNKESPSPQKLPEIQPSIVPRQRTKSRGNENIAGPSARRTKLRAAFRNRYNESQLPKRTTRLSSDSDKMPTLEPAVQTTSEEYLEASPSDLPILSPVGPSASNTEQKVLRGKSSSVFKSPDEKESFRRSNEIDVAAMEKTVELAGTSPQAEERDQRQSKGRRSKNDGRNTDKDLENASEIPKEPSKGVKEGRPKSRKGAPGKTANLDENRKEEKRNFAAKSPDETNSQKEGGKQRKEEGVTKTLETRSNSRAKLEKIFDSVDETINIHTVPHEVKKLIGSDSKEDLLTKLGLTSRDASSKRSLRQSVPRSRTAHIKSKVQNSEKTEVFDSGITSDARLSKKEKIDARRKSPRNMEKRLGRDRATPKGDNPEETNKVRDLGGDVKSAIKGRRSSSLTNENKTSNANANQSSSPERTKPDKLNQNKDVEVTTQSKEIENSNKRQTRGSLLNSGDLETQSKETSELNDTSLKKNTSLGKRRGRIKSSNEVNDKKNATDVTDKSNSDDAENNSVTETIDKESEESDANVDNEPDKVAREEHEEMIAKDETIQAVDGNSAAEHVDAEPVNVNLNHLQLETSNSLDSGKENSLETPVVVQKLKVGRPKKSWGSRRERTTKRSLSNVIGILTEGMNIPVEVQQSVVLTVQTSLDNVNPDGILQNNAQQPGESNSATKSLNFEKNEKSCDNDNTLEITSSDSVVEETQTCVQKSNEEEQRQIETPTKSSNVEVDTLSKNSKDEPGSKEQLSPANDIILDLSRRKQKGKGSFLEKIVSKIAKQKDALLEGEVGSLLDTAAVELTSILDEVGPTFAENPENPGETRSVADKVKIVKRQSVEGPTVSPLAEDAFDDTNVKLDATNIIDDAEMAKEQKLSKVSETREIANCKMVGEDKAAADCSMESEKEITADNLTNSGKVVPAENHSAPDGICFSSISQMISEPLTSTSQSCASMETENAIDKDENIVIEESKPKRKSKKRSLDTNSPKKNKRKSVDESENADEGLLASEELHLADIIKLIDKSKQVPFTKETTGGVEKTNENDSLYPDADGERVRPGKRKTINDSEQKDLSSSEITIENNARRDEIIETNLEVAECTKKLKTNAEENEKHVKSADEESNLLIENQSERDQRKTNVEENRSSALSLRTSGKRKSYIETTEQYSEIESQGRRTSKRRSMPDDKPKQPIRGEIDSKMETAIDAEDSVIDVTSDTTRRRSSRTKYNMESKNDENEGNGTDDEAIFSTNANTEAMSVSNENLSLPLEKCESTKKDVPVIHATILRIPEVSKIFDRDCKVNGNVENGESGEKITIENPTITDSNNSEKFVDTIIVPKVPKKRGRKKKILANENSQLADVVSLQNEPRVEMESTESFESPAIDKIASRKSTRTNPAIETEDPDKNLTAVNAQVTSPSLEHFKIPEVTEVLQHTKKRTSKRKSMIEDHQDAQHNFTPESETNNTDHPNSNTNLREKEQDEQLERPCKMDTLGSSESQKRSSRSSDRDQADRLERSSSSGSIDLAQTGRTRSSRRKQLSSEDLSGQAILNCRAESVDNLSEASCASESSYFRKKRFSRKKKGFQEPPEDVQTDASITDSESVDAEKRVDRRQSLKRRAKENISFILFDFDLPMDIPDSLQGDDALENANEEPERKSAVMEEKLADAVSLNANEEDKVDDKEVPGTEESIPREAGVPQTEEDFQTPKKRAAGNFVVVHKKTGEILIVEKRKKLTKEAARFFCDVCATSFTRKSSLKKHNLSQSHLLQIAKSGKEKGSREFNENASAESSEEICDDNWKADESNQNETSNDGSKDFANESEDVLRESDDDSQIISDSLQLENNESRYSIEPGSMVDLRVTRQEVLEDELLDEEICKITENMSHDEYVLTDHVSPAPPESSSTPVKPKVKKLGDSGKKKRAEKKREKAKKKNLADEHLALDTPEPEKPLDSTILEISKPLISDMREEIVSKEVLQETVEKSASVDSSLLRDVRSTSGTNGEDFPEKYSEVADELQVNQKLEMQVESIVAPKFGKTKLPVENDRNMDESKRQCLEADYPDNKLCTFERKHDKTIEDFSKITSESNAVSQRNHGERVSLKFTITKCHLERSKGSNGKSETFELNPSNNLCFKSSIETEKVQYDLQNKCENNLHLLSHDELNMNIDSVVETSQTKRESNQFDVSSDTSRVPKVSIKIDWEKNGAGTTIPKVLDLNRTRNNIDEIDCTKSDDTVLDESTEEREISNDDTKMGNESTQQHVKSKKSKAKKHSDKVENSGFDSVSRSDDRISRKSSKSKRNQNKRAMEEIAESLTVNNHEGSFQHSENVDRASLDKTKDEIQTSACIDKLSIRIRVPGDRAKSRNENEHAPNELETTDNCFQIQTKTAEEVFPTVTSESREERTEIDEEELLRNEKESKACPDAETVSGDKIETLLPAEDDEISSSSSLADKPLLELLSLVDDKFETKVVRENEGALLLNFPNVAETPEPAKQLRIDDADSKASDFDSDENSFHADTSELIDSVHNEPELVSDVECETAQEATEKMKPIAAVEKVETEIPFEHESNEAVPEAKSIEEAKDSYDAIESKAGVNSRKSSTSDRQNVSKKSSKSHKAVNKDGHRKSRTPKAKSKKSSPPRTRIADLSSESNDSDDEDKIGSQNKGKIVKSVFGRVFGGEKTDKVKEVLNDWVSKSEDDSDLSRAGFRSATPNETHSHRSRETLDAKNEERSKKRHSVSSTVSSGSKKRSGRKPKKSLSSERAKEKSQEVDNEEEHRSGSKHSKSRNGSNNRRKQEAEGPNNHFISASQMNEMVIPTSRCRQSKKRAEERISRAFESESPVSCDGLDANRAQRSLKHKEVNYVLRNQSKPDTVITDNDYAPFDYDGDAYKDTRPEDHSNLEREEQKSGKRRKSSVSRKSKRYDEEEDWKDLVIEKGLSAINAVEHDDETDAPTMKNLSRRPSPTSRLSVDLESSRSCSSLAPSSVRNRSPSPDRNSQSTRGESEEEEISNRRISPLFVCETPRSSVGSSSNSENEEEVEEEVEEEEEEEEDENSNDEELETGKRSSSEFSGEKIVIRSPSSNKTEVVTIAPTDAIEDNALDVPQEIEATKPRQGKVLNFDEELFVECCSRLKATTENELRGAKKIKLDHIEGYHRKEDQQQGFRAGRDRWRDVESQNSLGSLLESVNQLLGEEMYSTRERDYPKRGGRNLRSEHSSRSASPDMSRADNLGYEDSLDVAFEHNNKLRDKIQQRMRESEDLIASTFGQKSGNEVAEDHREKGDQQEALRNSYARLHDQGHGSSLSNGGYNDDLHARNPQEQAGKLHLDSSGFKSKMNSALGGLLDKALSNLLHSNGKHDHNGSTPMKVLAELACARAPTSTAQEDVRSVKVASVVKDSVQDPSPADLPKDVQKKTRNPIKELFERKKEMNERKQQEKSKSEAALRELNVHRQRKGKKTKKRQEFPLIRRGEHGGLAEKKKRRDGLERKEELTSDKIKDVYDFDEDESQMESSLGGVMSYRNKVDKGYEVSCLRTKELDVAGLMSKAIGDTLENGKTKDALGTRLESMIDRKFKELEKFAPKTKGALKAFQSEEQQRHVTGPMDDFIERKQQRPKRLVEQNLKHSKLKKHSKNPRKKGRNAWYENDSSDEYRTVVKTEDIGVGISKSQRTCSKGKQNLFAELSTSSDDEAVDYGPTRQRRVKKNTKKIQLEGIGQSQEVGDKFCLENEEQVDEWRDQDLKNDDNKNDCDNKKSESEMSDHPLVIDERKDMDEQRNSDDETENQYETNFALDDLYREDSSVADSDAEETTVKEARNAPDDSRVESPCLQDKVNEKSHYMQEDELIPLEDALDLLDQADTNLTTKYENVNNDAKTTDHVDELIVAESVTETYDPVEESDKKCPSPVEEQEEEPDDDIPTLPEKLSSNEKPQKESENLPLHVFLSRKVQESKKRKEQQLKKMQEEQERILMEFQPTRRQRKCAIGKQGLLAEISSSDDEACAKDNRRSGDKSDHEKPRKQKRESKEKRKERYIEKKHELMIAKEQKAIEEEILRELWKKKETFTDDTTDACLNFDVTKEEENGELLEHKVMQQMQKKRHQTKEKQRKSSKADENVYAKNNNGGLSDVENDCDKSTHELSSENHENENNQQSSPAKQKRHSKSPTKQKRVSKVDTKATVGGKKNRNPNGERSKSRMDSKASKEKERRSSSGKRDSDDEELKTTRSWNKVEEGVGVAIGRRKRAAANQLYYWSSSSDEEELVEVVPTVEEEEDDRQEQHGWIVGDSHKRMITMLAMEKQLKEKRRRSEDEFEPGRTKSKKHRNSTS